MTYSKREYEVTQLRLSELSKQSEHYQFGFALDSNNNYESYVQKFGKPVGGSTPWIDYLTGRRDKEMIEAHKLIEKYRISEFIKKYHELCKEYDAEIISADGYSGTIGSCKNIDFELG